MADAEDAHAVLHLSGYAILAYDWPRITQAACFPLHNEAPQGVTGGLNQLCPFAAILALHLVELIQGGECYFQSASKAAECGRLFLRNFVVERDGGA